MIVLLTIHTSPQLLYLEVACSVEQLFQRRCMKLQQMILKDSPSLILLSKQRIQYSHKPLAKKKLWMFNNVKIQKIILSTLAKWSIILIQMVKKDGFNMEWEHSHGLMEVSAMVSGRKGKWKDLELFCLKIKMFMLECLKETRRMVLECFIWQMGISMRENGKMINSMEKQSK